MSARTARRRRKQMLMDPRYKKKDPVASARRLREQIEREKRMSARKK